MGIPSKLDDDLQKRLCNLLMQGTFRAPAVKSIGLDYSTFWRWMQWGTDRIVTDERGKKKRIRARPRYRLFRNAIEQAESMSEIFLVQTVRKAAYEVTKDAEGNPTVSVRDWRAAQWLLERKFPERWAAIEARAEVDPSTLSDGSDPSPATFKRPVVFGGRYMPGGALNVPTLPPAKNLEGVRNVTPERPHDEPVSADDGPAERGDTPRPKVPDV